MFFFYDLVIIKSQLILISYKNMKLKKRATGMKIGVKYK